MNLLQGGISLNSEIRINMEALFEFFGNPADHLEGDITLVPVLVFFIGIDLGEVAGLQGRLLPFFVDQGTAAFDYIVHVHYNILRVYALGNSHNTLSERHLCL